MPTGTRLMPNNSPLLSRLCAFALFTTLIALAHTARAQQSLPEGSLGWSYYISFDKVGYAADPVTACQNNAQNHMGTPLLAMRPYGDKGTIDCKYKSFINAGGEEWFNITQH